MSLSDDVNTQDQREQTCELQIQNCCGVLASLADCPCSKLVKALDDPPFPVADSCILHKIVCELGEILRICGIPNRKIEGSCTAIMHSYTSAVPDGKRMFRINQGTFTRDLISNSWMTKAEMRLTYYIAKTGLRSILGIEMTDRRGNPKKQRSEWDRPVQNIAEEIFKMGSPNRNANTEIVLRNFQNAYRFYIRWRNKRGNWSPDDVHSSSSSNSSNSSEASDVSKAPKFDVLRYVPGDKCVCPAMSRHLQQRIDLLREKYSDPLYTRVKIHICKCKKSKRRKFGDSEKTASVLQKCKRMSQQIS